MWSEALKQTQALLFAGCTAFGIVLALTPFVRSLAVRAGWVTKPVEDRWGRRVIARLGGLAMFLGFVAATLCWIPWTPPVRRLLVGALLRSEEHTSELQSQFHLVCRLLL